MFAPAIARATIAFLSFSAALLANPLTWLGIVLGLVVNDIWHWVHGTESGIELVLGKWSDFKVKFMSTVDVVTKYFRTKFDSMLDYFSEIYTKIQNIVKNVTGIFSKEQQVESQGVKVVGTKQDETNLSTSRERLGVRLAKKIKSINANNIEQKTIETVRLPAKELVNIEPIDNSASTINARKITDAIKPTTNEVKNITIDAKGINENLMKLPLFSNPANSFLNNRANNIKVQQNINENITINVPEGTTAEQSQAISEQVAEAIREQFNFNISKALDAIPMR